MRKKKIGVKKEGRKEESKKERKGEKESEGRVGGKKKIGRWTTAKGKGNRKNVSTNNTHTHGHGHAKYVSDRCIFDIKHSKTKQAKA